MFIINQLSCRSGTALLTYQWLFIFVGAAASFKGSVSAKTEPAVEYKVKATFIFNFIRYVRWPQEASSDVDEDTIVCGFYGNEDVKSAIMYFDGQTIAGKRLIVRRFDADPVDPCHILFISAAARNREHELLRNREGSFTLTVGESDSFIDAGGIVNFVIAGGKVRFNISNSAAKRAKLRISSSLLSLAAEVQ